MRLKNTTVITLICLSMLTAGCASEAHKDPLEGINRGIYKFNDVTDKAVLKPVAGAYKAVVPSPLRTGVNNFFGNLGTVVTAINDLLQFKFDKAFTDIGRVAINTTFGVAGLIDVASMDGIEQRNEDFGQTLGHWGVGTGPYLVLPFLGSSTVRDTAGLVVDTVAFDPISYIDEPSVRNSLRGVKFLDKRAQLLPASDLLDDAALDPYAFMRDAYLQRRASQVQDGIVPPELLKDDDSYNTSAPVSAEQSATLEPLPAPFNPDAATAEKTSEAVAPQQAELAQPETAKTTETKVEELSASATTESASAEPSTVDSSKLDSNSTAAEAVKAEASTSPSVAAEPAPEIKAEAEAAKPLLQAELTK
jgi:phospholipid-binding lipoprotein MlaA